MALCGLLAAAAYLFSLSSVQDSEKRSEYECGFEPFDSATRLPFDVHFYLVGILFLIFDVEIALLFPWVLSLRTTGWFGFYLMMGFIALLAIGFLYEWKRGALIWPARQQEMAYVFSSQKALFTHPLMLLITTGYYPVVWEFYFWAATFCAVLLFTAPSKKQLTAKGCIAAVLPYDNTNQLLVLNQLPRSVKKAKLSARLKHLNRTITSWRFSVVEDYTTAARFMERRLHFFKASINFYINKITELTVLCRSKNFYNDGAVSAAEQSFFSELRTPVKEYNTAVDHCRMLYKKATSSQLFKKQRPVTSAHEKLAAAVRKYLYFRYANFTKTGKSTQKTARQLRKNIIALTKLNKPSLRARRKAAQLAAVAFTAPSAHEATFLTDIFSYASQFFGGFLPEMLLTVSITAVLTFLALDLGNGRLKKELAMESAIALRYALAYTAGIYFLQMLEGATHANIMFSGYVWTSLYVAFFKLLTATASYFILTASQSYISEHKRHLIEYPLTMVIATLFMLLLVGSSHLVSAFLAIVGFSLNLYVLVLFDATAAVAREAGVKYFYLSTLSSGLMMYSIFLITLTLGTGSLFEMAQILSTDVELSTTGSSLLHVAVIFLLVGLFFKLSAFPGHLWAAEVYEGSPDPIAGFFMLPVKIAVLGFVIHLLAVTFASISIFWQPLVMLSASISMIWGCFAALAEKKTKRFLAYTSINQMGFLLLGLATASFEGYRSTVVYLIIYIVMNIGFLTVFLTARRTSTGATLRYLTDFRELGQQDAMTSWSLAIVLFSMAGIPPLAGFFGKYYLLLHAQEQGFYGLVIVGLVTSLASAYYYLRLIKIMWFEGSEGLAAIRFAPTRGQYYTFFAVELFLWVFIIYGFAVSEFAGAVVESACVVYQPSFASLS